MVTITDVSSLERSKDSRKKRARTSSTKTIKKSKSKSSKSDKTKVSSKSRSKSSSKSDKVKSSSSKDKIKKKSKKKKKLSERAREKRELKSLSNATSSTTSLERQFEEVASNLTIKEAEQLREYFEMFNSLRDITRIKEEHCRRNADSRDIYALMQLYNQMREVIADIRTIRDVSGIVVALRDDVIDPLIQSAANEVVTFNQTLKQFVLKHFQGDDALTLNAKIDELCGNSGQALQDAYNSALDMTAITLEQQ